MRPPPSAPTAPPIAAPAPGAPTAAPMMAPEAAPKPPPTKTPFSRLFKGCEQPLRTTMTARTRMLTRAPALTRTVHLLWDLGCISSAGSRQNISRSQAGVRREREEPAAGPTSARESGQHEPEASQSLARLLKRNDRQGRRHGKRKGWRLLPCLDPP